METLLVETVGLRGGDHDPTGGAALLGCLCDRELEPCAWVTAKNIIKLHHHSSSTACTPTFVQFVKKFPLVL